MGEALAAQPNKRVTNAELGMFVLLASFTMLFSTLLLSYLLIRARQSVWPPIGTEPLGKQLSTLSTLVVVLSSGAMHFSVKYFGEGLRKEARYYWNAGLALGLVFVGLQVMFLRQMWDQGLRVAKGPFASINYTLIIVHGLHVILAFLPLIWISRKLANPSLSATSESPKLTSWFWHFLGLVWVLTYLLLVWY
jgi:heme/copper-type cytochrome/quinol oxidase subunit 3